MNFFFGVLRNEINRSEIKKFASIYGFGCSKEFFERFSRAVSVLKIFTGQYLSVSKVSIAALAPFHRGG